MYKTKNKFYFQHLSDGRLVSVTMQLLLGFFVCCCFLSFVETLTTGTYEQAQIMQTTDGNNILKSGFTEHIGTYKVLKQPDVCSYKHLSACHLNEIDQENYHRFCFKDVCPQDEYFCLNGNSYTLHICGYMPMCRKRFRNIAVYNRPDQETVDVYTVRCPDGYLQLSVYNCFTPCIEDNSIVVIRGSSPNQNALGYCNSEKNYCNRHDVSMFELSSDDDVCKMAETGCPDTEYLLPNCSCAVKCLPHQTRSWENDFSCQQPDHVSSSPSTVIQTPGSTTNPRPSPSTVITVRNAINSENATDTKISTVVIIVLCFLILLVVIVALLVNKYRSQREYQEVPRGHEQGNIKKDKTIVNGNLIKIKSVRIGNQNVPDNGSRDSSQTMVLKINENDSDDLNVNEHDLENLKEHFKNQDDSGFFTSEQTCLKKL